MAHSAQRNFFERVKRSFPEYFKGKKVLDCGSLDVNGTLKDLFEDCEYTGVDIHEGKNVDIVSLVHELDNTHDGKYDTIVSAEMLEHDEFQHKSIKRMIEMLRQGGLIVISAAGQGREPHGLGGEGEADWATTKGYYQNILNIDLAIHVIDIGDFYIEENPIDCDIYMVAIKGDGVDVRTKMLASRPKYSLVQDVIENKIAIPSGLVELNRKLALPYVRMDMACGLNFHERENPDWIRHDGDMTAGLDICCDWNSFPLPDKSIDEIHFSEAVEHFKIWEIDKPMKEINRILKPGGRLWGTTPNLEWVCRSFAEGKNDIEWTLSNLYGDRSGEHHVHYTLYTADTLRAMLNRFGFDDVMFEKPGGDKSKDWWWLAFSAIKKRDV